MATGMGFWRCLMSCHNGTATAQSAPYSSLYLAHTLTVTRGVAWNGKASHTFARVLFSSVVAPSLCGQLQPGGSIEAWNLDERWSINAGLYIVLSDRHTNPKSRCLEQKQPPLSIFPQQLPMAQSSATRYFPSRRWAARPTEALQSQHLATLVFSLPLPPVHHSLSLCLVCPPQSPTVPVLVPTRIH